MASNRAPVLAELPRGGMPPAFATYGEWEAWVERLVRLGVTQDYTRIWWDVRPHPKLGTLEIRMPDQPTDVVRSGAFAELVRGLAAWALEQTPRPHDPTDAAVYQQNRWAASRFGPRAELIHPDRAGGSVAANALYAELTERIGADPLDVAVCEADTQLTFADPRAATADVVQRSLA